ncbi:SRPBCC family protein [Pseudoduganella sp. S-14]|jgi:hypothetical protein|uniref:SRPBCC family protein n=1 Tax=Pseudoduganella sp. S-14 TaxID=3404065 RepID=UPI003CED79AA
MWTHRDSIETSASPEIVWQLFRDVPGWKTWNAGIEAIALHGPFTQGTTFTMQPPGSAPFTSTLLEVEENRGFTDVTEIDGTRVVVRHLIAALPDGGSRVTYATEIIGPQAADFGPMVTGDFPEVLAGLKRVAEGA